MLPPGSIKKPLKVTRNFSGFGKGKMRKHILAPEGDDIRKRKERDIKKIKEWRENERRKNE